VVTDDDESPVPKLSRRQEVGIYICMLFAVAAIAGLGLRPWRVAAGNPSLAGRHTATSVAQLVGGCSTSDTKNYFSCAQVLEFDVGSVRVRGRVLVTDGFRKSDEVDASVPVIYDQSNPTRFRLPDGNPGVFERVFGTAWLTFASAVLGVMAGGALAGGGIWGWRRLTGSGEPDAAETPGPASG
jgi:hypothetical protein